MSVHAVQTINKSIINDLQILFDLYSVEYSTKKGYVMFRRVHFIVFF